MSQKISIPISDELDSALSWAVQSRRQSKSSVIETFLRENKEVNSYIERIRKQPKTSVYFGHDQSKVKKGVAGSKGKIVLTPSA